MYKEALRPVWAEINLKNLDYNIKNIKRHIGKDTELIGVVKADGYGHGALEVAKKLRANGVKTFAVATLQEAISLREGGIDEEIILLSLTPDMYADTIVKYGLTPVVCTYANAAAISQAAIASVGGMRGVVAGEADHAGSQASASRSEAATGEVAGEASSDPLGEVAGTTSGVVAGFIAADTGMGRIGYMTATDSDLAAAVSDIVKIAQLKGFRIKGLCSHMATADEVDKSYSNAQDERFLKLLSRLREAGICPSLKTFASSAATIDLPETHFDAVRPGIILYGLYPSGDVNKCEIDLKPVMSVKANIVHLKEIPEGHSVGYGRKFVAKRPTKIATISLGYADGFARPYSKEGKVIINGCYAPIAGNICMDQCMLDVTDVKDVKLGDEVILLGSDGNLTITAEEIAEKLGTINYEIICSFGQRIPKIYIE